MLETKRRADALKRLHVTEKELAAASQITHFLKKADGGFEQVMTAMRFSQDETIIEFLKRYDATPVGDREHVPVEAIALAAQVNINLLMGSIMQALHTQETNINRMIMLTGHRKVTESRLKFAQMASGEKDRTALDIAVGILPSPKGNTFVNKTMIFGSGKAAMDQQRVDSGDDDEADSLASGEIDLDKLFPPANRMQERLIPIRQKMLPPG